MRWIIPIAMIALFLTGIIWILRSPHQESKVERRRRIQLWMIFASWPLLALALEYQGGNALSGEIEKGRYLIRHHPHPGSVATEVSPQHWLVSLLAESLVFGIGPLLGLVLVRRIHVVFLSVWFTRIAVAFGGFWAFAIGIKAAVGIKQWLAAVSNQGS